MNELYLTALGLGFAGSFHCLGMCGPIALAIQGGQTSGPKLFLDRLLYNLGRAITYGFLGAIAGLIGHGLSWLVGYQVYLTVFLAVMMIAFGIFTINPDKLLNMVPFLGGWFQWIRKQLGKFMRDAKWYNFFTIGVLNGFLPCGLVYMAMIAALSTGNAFEGMSYMIAFGMGTIPMMFGVAVAGQFLEAKVRSKVKKIYPVLFLAMGALLMMRAYNIHESSKELAEKPMEQVEMKCH
ncbi:sulfite exporter TauE/SafE family protein [Flammeovirga sp. MY04]|uniref:sulfite exporter TauE/SafE family protein n=1 Tax=Flammeovirga sp. MY04 TaxID=1191459 RepID=UPI000806440C|nr:sulfite exporter TauE/SafE family protein [Flammeovirga sp. MY04]ANQ51131.1 sulfite exporter TauE/SafE family protein [Flammeovirga sp. MY04]